MNKEENEKQVYIETIAKYLEKKADIPKLKCILRFVVNYLS